MITLLNNNILFRIHIHIDIPVVFNVHSHREYVPTVRL